jgi:hypothetical protein
VISETYGKRGRTLLMTPFEYRVCFRGNHVVFVLMLVIKQEYSTSAIPLSRDAARPLLA